MQLRKVCNHPFVFEEVENTLNPDHVTDQMIIRVSGKFELLDRLLGKLKATGHRVCRSHISLYIGYFLTAEYRPSSSSK